MVQERLAGLGQGGPEALRVVPGDGAGGPGSLDVACEHAQDLTEGQVGVAHARVGVAIATSD